MELCNYEGLGKWVLGERRQSLQGASKIHIHDAVNGATSCPQLGRLKPNAAYLNGTESPNRTLDSHTITLTNPSTKAETLPRRMYTNYAQQKGWICRRLDATEGDAIGLKSLVPGKRAKGLRALSGFFCREA